MREVDVQLGRRIGLDLGCSVEEVVEGGKPLGWEDLRHTMEGVEGSTTTGEDMAVTAEVAAATMEGAGAEVASGTIDLPGSKTTTGTRTGAEEEVGTGEDLHTEGLHLQGAGRHQDHLAGRLPHPHLEWEGPHPLHRRMEAEGGVATECLLLETTTSTPHHLRRHREEEGLEGLHPRQEIQDTLRTEEVAGPDLCHRPLEPRPQARREEEEDRGRPQGLRRAHPRLDGEAGGEAVDPAGAPRPRPHPHLVVGQGTISAL